MQRRNFVASLASLIFLPFLRKEKDPKRFELGKIYRSQTDEGWYVFFNKEEYYITRIDGTFTANKRILNERLQNK